MRKPKTFKRENCDNQLRATITDKFGRKVVLLGKYAFEWHIVLEENGRTIINTYPNGKIARKEFNLLKKKR